MINPLEKQLISWADIASGSTQTEGLSLMSEALIEAFSKLPGAKCELIALQAGEAKAVRVTMRPHLGKRVLCSGHYDTVYSETHPVKACEYVGTDLLLGPGVADMKGGLVVMLEALRLFELSEEAKDLGWEVLITPDEETGSAGSAPLILKQADGAVAALVFEPARANGNLVRGRMGTGVMEIQVQGKAAHAAAGPGAGINAILVLCDWLQKADRLAQGIQGVLLNVGAIEGGGPVNVVPALASATINVRAATQRSADLLIEGLRQLARESEQQSGASLRLSGGFERGPKEWGTGEEALFAAYAEACRTLGITPPDWEDAAGGSDGNLIAQRGIPTLDGMGVIGGKLHSSEEYCIPSSLGQRAQAAAALLRHLARSS